MKGSVTVILPHFSINGVTKVALNEVINFTNIQIISVIKERRMFPFTIPNLKIKYVTESEIFSRLRYPHHIDFLDSYVGDLIISHNKAGAIAAHRLYKRTRVPYVAYEHNADQNGINGTLIKFERADVKESLESATVLLANSKTTAMDLETLYGVRAKVLYPGCYHFPSKDIINNKENHYLVVHFISKNDTFDILYKLLNRNKEIRIIIAGARKYGWQLVYTVFKLKFGGRVDFIFDPDDNVIAQLYKRSKMLLNTGIESFGMSPLEAAGYGTPSVAVRGSGIFEVLQDTTEILSFEKNNVEELDTIIRQHSNDPTSLEHIGEKAWDKSRKFDWNAHRQQLFKSIDSS